MIGRSPTPTPTTPIPTVGEADRIAWALALTSTRTLAPAADKLCLAVEGALIRLARLGNSGAWVRSSEGIVIVRGTLPGAPEGFGRWEVRLSATPHRIDPYAPPETLADLLRASADK